MADNQQHRAGMAVKLLAFLQESCVCLNPCTFMALKSYSSAQPVFFCFLSLCPAAAPSFFNYLV
jgi:hypothetical protein